MSDLSQALSFIKVKSIALEMENKRLAKKCCELLSKNIVLEGELKRVKQLNKSIMKINIMLSDNIKPF